MRNNNAVMAIYGHGYKWSCLCMIPVNIAKSKRKLININIDGKKSVVSNRKQSYFLISKKVYYHHEGLYL